MFKGYRFKCICSMVPTATEQLTSPGLDLVTNIQRFHTTTYVFAKKSCLRREAIVLECDYTCIMTLTGMLFLAFGNHNETRIIGFSTNIRTFCVYVPPPTFSAMEPSAVFLYHKLCPIKSVVPLTVHLSRIVCVLLL